MASPLPWCHAFVGSSARFTAAASGTSAANVVAFLAWYGVSAPSAVEERNDRFTESSWANTAPTRASYIHDIGRDPRS